MYRIVIADDNFQIRKGLSLFVDWKALGFSVVGCFEDGSEVIEYLKEHEADVVFTDIEMVNVSGIELAAWVAANRPEMTVVFISGRQEFEYARKALAMGVFDYIPKPIVPEEIAKVFSRVKERLGARSEKIRNVDSLPKEKAEQMLTPEYLVERTKEYISRSVTKNLSLDDIAEHAHVSKSYLVKQFKKYTGETVMDCVLRTKMERAIYLLKAGQNKPEILADEVGYGDVRYFQRIFKNYTGYGVKEYYRLLH